MKKEKDIMIQQEAELVWRLSDEDLISRHSKWQKAFYYDMENTKNSYDLTSYKYRKIYSDEIMRRFGYEEASKIYNLVTK